MHFYGIESSRNVMKNLTVKKIMRSFEYSLIFSPLIISNSFQNALD